MWLMWERMIISIINELKLKKEKKKDWQVDNIGQGEDKIVIAGKLYLIWPP